MTPGLATLQRQQGGVFRRRQALAAGYSAAAIEVFLDAGVWWRVRHGIYSSHYFDAQVARRDRRVYLLAAAARQLVIAGDTVLSHAAAAAWHDLALLGEWPAEPTLTRHRPDGAGRMTAHDIYVAPMPMGHRVPGEQVSSAARTVVDCARSFGVTGGLVVAESALRRGLGGVQLEDVLRAEATWPGIVQAREAVAFAEEWSETAIESLTRLWLHGRGFPRPVQQRSIWTLEGRFLAEVDFVWEDMRTVLETDGRKKYADDEPAAAGEDARGVVWKEKLREDGLRDVGLEVVRGYWSDVTGTGADLESRLRRGFGRGQRATESPRYRIGPPLRRHARPLAA